MVDTRRLSQQLDAMQDELTEAVNQLELAKIARPIEHLKLGRAIITHLEERIGLILLDLEDA